MIASGSIVSEFATGVGLLAGMIAVGGFIAHAKPVLSGDREEEVRRATVIGGTIGLGVGLSVVVLSALVSKVLA